MQAGVAGGTSVTKSERAGFEGFFVPSDFDGLLEAAFLLKPTGIALAAWTRSPIPQEVVSVMAATLWGSLDTLVRTLGGRGPRSALLEVEGRRILAMQIEPNWMLLLVAPHSVGKRRLRHEAQRIVERVAAVRGKSASRAALVTLRG